VLKIVHTLSVQDFLRVARRVCGYAVRLYEEAGFHVQMPPKNSIKKGFSS